MPEPAPSLLSYPTEFPLKVLGKRNERFAQTMLSIVMRHAPDFRAETIEMRPSREGQYLSLTFTINAVSREQLDALYQELCDHPMVTMVL
ncbi:MAG: YbeD family protein [Burkholderiales bacterium]